MTRIVVRIDLDDEKITKSYPVDRLLNTVRRFAQSQNEVVAHYWVHQDGSGNLSIVALDHSPERRVGRIRIKVKS